MQWLNEPTQWTSHKNRLSATSDARTDFWRKTHDSGIRDHGHFYFESVAGDFTARVKITAEYKSKYDQAGLMVRGDEKTWLKCRIEVLDGRQYARAVCPPLTATKTLAFSTFASKLTDSCVPDRRRKHVNLGTAL